MRIAVIGAGGVGGGFGAALAKAGADVTFIARGAHLAAMKTRGPESLEARAATRIWCRPRQPTIPPSIGTVDIVLFCVKLWDVESAGDAIKPLIGPDTAVIPLQNGIDAARAADPDPRARGRDGRRGADLRSIAAPGVITQVGTFMRMVFGELDGSAASAARIFSRCARRPASTRP